MKKPLSSCAECGESKSILTQVSNTIEIIYLCSDCYKDKYSGESRNKIGRIRDIQVHNSTGKIYFLSQNALWLMENAKIS